MWPASTTTTMMMNGDNGRNRAVRVAESFFLRKITVDGLSIVTRNTAQIQFAPDYVSDHESNVVRHGRSRRGRPPVRSLYLSFAPKVSRARALNARNFKHALYARPTSVLSHSLLQGSLRCGRCADADDVRGPLLLFSAATQLVTQQRVPRDSEPRYAHVGHAMARSGNVSRNGGRAAHHRTRDKMGSKKTSRPPSHVYECTRRKPRLH